MHSPPVAPQKAVDFQVLYIDDDADRAFEIWQAFSPLVRVVPLTDRAQALAWFEAGKSADLVIINDALGGLNFLASLDSARLGRPFSTMLLRAGAATDTSVQAEGQPLIDVFPLAFDQGALRDRLAYLIRKKAYGGGLANQSGRVRKLSLPVGKRLFDVAVSLGILLVISPLLAVVALLIRLDSKGSIFYKSKRVGMGYRVFEMYKFRTMRTGSDALISGMASQNMYQSALPEAPPDALCETCVLGGIGCQRPLFEDNQQVCELQVQRSRQAKAMFMKFKEDPRVTRLGKFLRNASIDELPQLLNILWGDMSFVGNRPLPLYEAEKLTTLSYARRFEAPAGLTGLWQVTKRGRSSVSDQERIHLDALYARTYSFKTDLFILLRTVKAVFQKEDV